VDLRDPAQAQKVKALGRHVVHFRWVKSAHFKILRSCEVPAHSRVPARPLADQNQGKPERNKEQRKAAKPGYSISRTSTRTRRKASDREETITGLKARISASAIHRGGSL
jgi:hypothetical protein